MNYKRSRKLFELCLVIGGPMAAAGSKKSNLLLACLGVSVLLVGVVQVWIFYRCPHCGAKLQFMGEGKNLDRCPKCSQKLDAEN